MVKSPWPDKNLGQNRFPYPDDFFSHMRSKDGVLKLYEYQTWACLQLFRLYALFVSFLFSLMLYCPCTVRYGPAPISLRLESLPPTTSGITVDVHHLSFLCPPSINVLASFPPDLRSRSRLAWKSPFGLPKVTRLDWLLIVSKVVCLPCGNVPLLIIGQINSYDSL